MSLSYQQLYIWEHGLLIFSSHRKKYSYNLYQVNSLYVVVAYGQEKDQIIYAQALNNSTYLPKYLKNISIQNLL
jgi:hypothetical protein